MGRRRQRVGAVAARFVLFALMLLLPTDAEYVRPPPSPALPLDHPLLARRPSRQRQQKSADGGGRRGGALPPFLTGRRHRAGATATGDPAPRPQPGPHDPEQLMLSLAGPGAMAVTWVTHPQEDEGLARGELGRKRRGGCDRLLELPLESVVRYGVVAGSSPSSGSSLSASSLDPETDLPLSATGSFTCYDADDYESGALHSATMGAGAGGPLLPGETYAYSVGSPSLGAWSEPRTFRAPLPPDGEANLPYRIAVVGDLGQTENSAETLEAMRQVCDFNLSSTAAAPCSPSPPGHVLNVGDLSYADGYQPRWDSWGRLVEPHASVVPWMVVEGNHEEELAVTKSGSGGGDGDDDDDDVDGFVSYRARYSVPSNSSGSGSKLYYSYEVPGAHVVMLGTYADWSRDSKQRAWLASDLARVDRSRTPWLVVGMHAPWYSSNTAHLDEVDGMRRSLEPLLLQHGADVVFTGHVHAYERTCRVARRRVDGRGPLHVVVGDGGNREGLSTNYLSPAPRWSEFREASYGHGALDLINSTHAVWRWLRNGQEGVGGPSPSSPVVAADETWIVRGGDVGLENNDRWWEEEEEGERGGVGGVSSA